MRNKYFDVDKFLSVKNNSIIETKHISEWLECSVRLVQKWCLKNNIKYHRKHGIKNYIWNIDTVNEFGKWYNRKSDKLKKIIVKPKKTKPEKIKNVISFITIGDIIIERFPSYRNKNMKKSYRTESKKIQRWCKNNDIPLVNFGGRKYYKITKKIKNRIIREVFHFNI